MHQSIHYSKETDEKVCYLTFDDGYPYYNTNKMCDILVENSVTATFFLTGDFIDEASSTTKKLVDSNMIVANHTWSHKQLKKLSKKDILNEFTAFEQKYEKITNKKLVKYFRPPGGIYTKDKLDYIISLGYEVFFWTIDYYDYDRQNDMGVTYAYASIMDNIKNGDIILMHTLTESNVLVLPRIINDLQAKGFRFGSLEEFTKNNV